MVVGIVFVINTGSDEVGQLSFSDGVQLDNLRSKKDLIENFINGINDVDDVMNEWHSYVAEKREKALVALITEEKLKEAETRAFIKRAFRDGAVKETGTDIDRILPAVSRFGGGNRKSKKENVIEKLKIFFERFWNIG